MDKWKHAWIYRSANRSCRPWCAVETLNETPVARKKQYPVNEQEMAGNE